MSDKQALRRELRAARARFAPTRPIQVSDAYRSRLTPGLIVSSYVPVGGEADPAPLEQAAVVAGCVLTLPHVVDRETPLRFLAWNVERALADGPFGLRQPPHDAHPLVPDIILTPLVGFDRRGHRLGQGAGHYDRAFAALPAAWRIGVAWSVQEVATLPADPWDVPLHAIATEQDWITP
jgi:5-formyltetrahydrofolate cyclo-ligase